MSTATTWQIESTSLDDTLRFAAAIGQALKGGELIELRGDLGSGKTSFVRGIAAGMGSTEQVHSPSFTLGNQYAAPKLTLHHFDFYRLNEAGIMRDELAEVLGDKNAVVVIEWPDVVETALPDTRLIIKLTASGENSRHLEFACPTELKYLLPEKP